MTSEAMTTPAHKTDPDRKRRCPACQRVFSTKNGMRNHHRAIHTEPREPSIASRIVDARLEVAMGGYAPDDVAEYL